MLIASLCSFLSYFLYPADALFGAVSTQLVKRSQKMMEKYRQLLYDESMVSCLFIHSLSLFIHPLLL